MTDIEKLKELVGCPSDISINDYDCDEYVKYAFEIASQIIEWKDNNFKNFLKKKKDKEAFIGGCASYQYGRRKILDEIIDEFFVK